MVIKKRWNCLKLEKKYKLGGNKNTSDFTSWLIDFVPCYYLSDIIIITIIYDKSHVKIIIS